MWAITRVCVQQHLQGCLSPQILQQPAKAHGAQACLWSRATQQGRPGGSARASACMAVLQARADMCAHRRRPLVTDQGASQTARGAFGQVIFR